MSLLLTEEEIEACREAFHRFDRDGSGTIDFAELKQLLQTLGHETSDADVFELMSVVDLDQSGAIDFSEFLIVVQKNKVDLAQNRDELDTVAAFVALGGREDKSGEIVAEDVHRIVKEFGLNISTVELLKELPGKTNGKLNFDQFAALLK